MVIPTWGARGCQNQRERDDRQHERGGRGRDAGKRKPHDDQASHQNRHHQPRRHVLDAKSADGRLG
jgi:hypothetical protein